MRNILIGGLLALVIAVPSTAAEKPKKIPKQMQKLLDMTPDQFAACASVSDDSLDVVAKISTEPCFRETRGLLKIVWNDNFLRAHIDKKTGKATFQVYQYIGYEGDWRFYQTVNYETPDGPRSEPVTEIARDVVGCSGSRYGAGCTLSEHVAFSVDEDLLRTIASKWQPGVAAGWRFKFGAKAAQDWQDGMSTAEVAGLLQVVDRYRAAHGAAK